MNIDQMTRLEIIKQLETILSNIHHLSPTSEEAYFLAQIRYKAEKAQMNQIRERQKHLKKLKVYGHETLAMWNGNPTPGCDKCHSHNGKNFLPPIRSVSTCMLDCPFCYYFGVKNKFELMPYHFYMGKTLHDEQSIKIIIDKIADVSQTGIWWVYYEPFMQIEKHFNLIEYISKKGIHQHMYTNGVNANRENLRQLSNAGLPELRFNLAATHCSDKILETMKIAREMFEYLVIESPMYDVFFAEFVEKRKNILETGIDHINLAELHLSALNIQNFPSPWYCYKEGYVSPIMSRKLTYDLLDMAEEEDWKVTIQDCSNETKYYRGVTEKIKVNGQVDYFQEIPIPKSFYLDAVDRYNLGQ